MIKIFKMMEDGEYKEVGCFDSGSNEEDLRLANKAMGDDAPKFQAEDILKLAIKHYSILNQLLKLSEECNELSRAIARAFIDPNAPDAHENLLEEIADVEIMIQQMRLYFGDTPINNVKIDKLSRLLKYIQEDKK